MIYHRGILVQHFLDAATVLVRWFYGAPECLNDEHTARALRCPDPGYPMNPNRSRESTTVFIGVYNPTAHIEGGRCDFRLYRIQTAVTKR